MAHTTGSGCHESAIKHFPFAGGQWQGFLGWGKRGRGREKVDRRRKGRIRPRINSTLTHISGPGLEREQNAVHTGATDPTPYGLNWQTSSHLPPAPVLICYCGHPSTCQCQRVGTGFPIGLLEGVLPQNALWYYGKATMRTGKIHAPSVQGVQRIWLLLLRAVCFAKLSYSLESHLVWSCWLLFKVIIQIEWALKI